MAWWIYFPVRVSSACLGAACAAGPGQRKRAPSLEKEVRPSMDRAYSGAPESPAPQSGGTGPHRKKKKKRFSIGRLIGRIFLVLFTLCVIGVLTAAIFAKIFMTYIDTTQIGRAHV